VDLRRFDQLRRFSSSQARTNFYVGENPITEPSACKTPFKFGIRTFCIMLCSTLGSDEIDWPGIRAAAVALNSVRLAAIKASHNLPTDEQRRFVERVNKRAYRER